MNSKSILFLTLVAVIASAASGVSAAPRSGGNFTSMGGGHPVMRGGAGTFSGNFRHFDRFDRFHRFDRFDRFHHRNFNDVIFIGDFGFPWWWGWGWGWGYPYGGYGYGYPYYGYGYGGYGYDYGQPGYGPYGGYGYGGYGNASHSRVAELQRRLARAGYYHGAIDGIMGPGTRRAIRAYERDHGNVG
jgi:Putative peptidoglycan binding domain